MLKKMELYFFISLLEFVITSGIESRKFKDTDCFDVDDISGYRGIKQKTMNGWKCQMWKRNKPWQHDFKPKKYPDAGLTKNYCRNPDNDTEPWCFTVKTSIKKQWDYCGVQRCEVIEATPAPLNETCGIPDILSVSTRQIKTVGQIVGGVESVPGSIPWQITIQMKLDNELHCGGSIITELFILTAAHCVYYDQTASNYYIIVGEHALDTSEGNERRYNLAQIILHENYDDMTVENDIALLKTQNEMTFTSYIKPICLPEADSLPVVGSTVTVSGWGVTKQNARPLSNQLREVSIVIVDNNKCQNKLNSISIEQVTNNAVCAGIWSEGGKDSCQGDSGGPLFAESSDGQYDLIGIVSWGIGCGKSKKPGVYTRVSAYIDWIESKIYD
ncbi:trypsin-1-like isoform X2 [Styela clava]